MYRGKGCAVCGEDKIGRWMGRGWGTVAKLHPDSPDWAWLSLFPKTRGKGSLRYPLRRATLATPQPGLAVQVEQDTAVVLLLLLAPI